MVEIGFADATTALCTDFEIQNVRALAFQVVLDSALVESFNRVLLSGRSLVFTQTEHNVTVARASRNYGRVRDFLGQRRGLQNPLAGRSHRRGEMQLGSLQYPYNPMKGASEHFHFLSILAGTYDNTVRNIDIGRVGYLRHSFIAGFPTERVPKMPLSGVSTRSDDLARFTFKGLDGTMTDLFIHLVATSW